MWSNRGAFVERGFLSGAPKISSDCAAKLLLFFDMAMGWSGLRACAPMIGQNARQDSKKKTQGVTEATLVTVAEYDKFYSSYTNYSGYSL